MIKDLYFATPQLLWAIPLLLIAGALFIRSRAKNRLFAASRLLVGAAMLWAAAQAWPLGSSASQRRAAGSATLMAVFSCSYCRSTC